MKRTQIRTVVGLAMILAVIAAITVGSFATSGSWTAKPGNPKQGEVGTPVDWKPEPSLSGGLKRFASLQELKDFLKTAPSYPGYWHWGGGRGGLMLDGALTFSAGENGPNYSKTNIQVEGVDEADIVKSDGEYIYWPPTTGWSLPEPIRPIRPEYSTRRSSRGTSMGCLSTGTGWLCWKAGGQCTTLGLRALSGTSTRKDLHQGLRRQPTGRPRFWRERCP